MRKRELRARLAAAEWDRDIALEAAEDWRRAAQRRVEPPVTVSRVDELAALPGGTVLVPVERTLAALQKGWGQEWWRATDHRKPLKNDDVPLPATVVYLDGGGE